MWNSKEIFESSNLELRESKCLHIQDFILFEIGEKYINRTYFQHFLIIHCSIVFVLCQFFK